MALVNQQNNYPNELLTATVDSLHALVPEPTLFHLSGKQQNPLFISVLLHGNETTGFLALQQLLLKYRHKQLPRSLSFFLGNTEAARVGLRRLDHQPDYNRVWPGTALVDTNEAKMMQQIVDIMAKRGLFASIDIHNNTGLNPHYACVNKLDHAFLQLAHLFGRLVIYFTQPKGIQSGALASYCPAVTLECGKVGQPHGITHAYDYIDSCLHLSELPTHAVPKQDIDIYHTVAQVTINQGIRFSFDDKHSDLLLDKELERMNFTEIPAGTEWGIVADNQYIPLTAKDPTGHTVTEKFFSVVDHALQINQKTMPAMLTLDERVIKQDCLCYLMERVKL